MRRLNSIWANGGLKACAGLVGDMTMNKTALTGVLVLAASLSGAAYAQPGMDRLVALDTNDDGTITQTEVEAQIAQDFADADTDGDGFLDEGEARAYHEVRHQERREARHERWRDRRGDREGGGRFERAAGDDHMIDLHEFSERGLHRFERADLDENGVVTETEMELVAEVMGRSRHGRHRGGRHGRHGDRYHDDD